MSNRWTKDNIPNLSGKVVVITGANSGIGFETASVLAEKEATVILAVRNADKGQAALHRIKSVNPTAKVEQMKLDLGDLSSIRTFVNLFKQKYESLSILINNAGIMNTPYGLTKDGFESQFGCNHLGHFALTGLLLPLLVATPSSRVVTLSSLAAHNAAIAFDNLDGSKGYSAFKFYGQSKLANLLFARELHYKLSHNEMNPKSIACHPGYSNTNLASFGSGKRPNLGMRLLAFFMSQPAHMGALPSLYSATSPDLSGGEYIGPDGRRGLKGFPKSDPIIEKLYHSTEAKKLWEVSEKLTGVSYNLD